jgi:serine/threonine protein phosphatase Stp1
MLIMTDNVSTSSMTHTGSVRAINEDALLAMPEVGMWVVADGMGGHEAGDYASRLVVSYLQQAGMRLQGTDLAGHIQPILQAANQELFHYAQQISPDAIVGTTVVILIMEGEQFQCFWSGDSRCYLLRENQFKQLTRDHTEGEEWIAQGVLTAEQALNTPNCERLTAAIGANETAHIDCINDYIYEGDRFLLCTDGINKVFPDHCLAQQIDQNNINEINQMFLRDALQQGAPDNLTSIIVSL